MNFIEMTEFIEKWKLRGIFFSEDSEVYNRYNRPDNFTGYYKIWHENGQLCAYRFYENGKIYGEYKMWHKNGQLYEHCFYENSKLHGEYKMWHKNGQLYEHCFYENDKIIKNFIEK